MKSWQFTLQDERGLNTGEVLIPLDAIKTLWHVERKEDDGSSSLLRFDQLGDDTQVRDQYVSDIELSDGTVRLKADVEGIQVRQPVLDFPRFRLPISTETSTFSVLLRHGDIVEFPDTTTTMKVSMIEESNPQVEVRSSAILDQDVQTETQDEVETDDDREVSQTLAIENTSKGTDHDTTQDPYSTSRERLSMSPNHHVVQESPVRPTVDLRTDEGVIAEVEPDVDLDEIACSIQSVATTLVPQQQPQSIEASMSSPKPTSIKKRKVITYGGSGSKRRRTAESERLDSNSSVPQSPAHDESSSTKMRKLRSSQSSTMSPGHDPNHDLEHDPDHDTIVVSSKPYRPRILFPTDSKIRALNVMMKFLRGEKVKEAADQHPRSFDIFCVDNGDLKTTAKLLISLVHKKAIVTEDWVRESQKQNRLLETVEFLPPTLKESMHKDRSKIFQNTQIYLTPKLRKDYGKGWTDIQAITKQMGATIICCVPEQISKKGRSDPDIYLGAENDDPSVAILQAAGKAVYRKDLLTQCVLAGEHVDEADFELPLVEDGASGGSAVKGKKGKAKGK